MNAKRGIAAVICAIFLAGTGAACSSANQPASRPRAVVTAEVPVAVQQPPTAREIAAQLGGTNFVSKKTGANLFGVTSLGTFYIGQTKYAVNVFTDTASRDAWLKVARKIGCNPKWETSKSVVYPSLTSGGK